MRIAHLSDFHFYAPPTLMGIFSKRLIGLVNLYVQGRIRHFSAEIAAQAVASVVAKEPDLVLISGDLTALSTPREFEFARQTLQPIIERFRTIMVPGNHDYYTSMAEKQHRFERYFQDCVRPNPTGPDDFSWPTCWVIGDVAILGMNQAQFTPTSEGTVDLEQLARLETFLRQPEVASRFRILLVHYPLFNRFGKPTQKSWRRLKNRQNLVDLLMKSPVHLVLHGHDHLRYLNHLFPEGHAPVFIYNAGSAAFARGDDYPIRASYNIYEVKENRLENVIHCDYVSKEFTTTYHGPPSLKPLLQPDATVRGY